MFAAVVFLQQRKSYKKETESRLQGKNLLLDPLTSLSFELRMLIFVVPASKNSRWHFTLARVTRLGGVSTIGAALQVQR